MVEPSFLDPRGFFIWSPSFGAKALSWVLTGSSESVFRLNNSDVDFDLPTPPDGALLPCAILPLAGLPLATVSAFGAGGVSLGRQSEAAGVLPHTPEAFRMDHYPNRLDAGGGDHEPRRQTSQARRQSSRASRPEELVFSEPPPSVCRSRPRSRQANSAAARQQAPSRVAAVHVRRRTRLRVGGGRRNAVRS
jgi:hypothetical protein